MGKTLWNGGPGEQGSDPRRGVVLALPRDAFWELARLGELPSTM
ncbi:hypothetical protein [Amycolatopsis sp. NPDC052450]